jgi:hypothetical protein
MDDLEILVGAGTFDWGKTLFTFLALQWKATDLAFKQYKTIPLLTLHFEVRD